MQSFEVEASYTLMDQPDALEQQPQTLSYLQNRSPVEIKQLEKRLGLSVPEMELHLHQNHFRFKAYKKRAQVSALAQTPYPFFAADKCRVGLQETVRLMIPGAKLSESVASPMGMTLAGLSGAFYVGAIDPEKMAIEQTLRYATRLPFKARFAQFCQSARQKPCQTLWESTKYVFCQTALNLTNSAGAMTNFLALSPLITVAVPWLWWPAFTFFHYFGNNYYDGTTNDAFWDGLNFWFEKHRPWLVQELPSQPDAVFAAFLEGVSATLMRSVGTCSVAIAARAEFGFWADPVTSFALALFTYFQQYYVASHKYYLEHKVETMKLLADTTHPFEIRSVPDRRQELEAKVLQGKTYGYAVKEKPSILAPCILFTGVGMRCGAYISPLGAIAGASLLLTWQYRAQSQRVLNELVYKEAIAEAKPQAQVVVNQQGCSNVGAVIVADILTISCGVGSATTAIGLAKDVVGDSAPLMTIYLIGTYNATINGVTFMLEIVRNSFRSLCGSKEPRVSAVHATMYHQSNPPPDAGNVQVAERTEKRSWFGCLGRGR